MWHVDPIIWRWNDMPTAEICPQVREAEGVLWGGRLTPKRRRKGQSCVEPLPDAELLLFQFPLWPTLAWNHREGKDSRKSHSQLKQTDDRIV